jgi:FkbM family methyltransferase
MLPIRMSTQIFLRSRKYPGCREFSFSPHLSRLDGRFVAVDVRARDSAFSTTLRLRPDSTDVEIFSQIFLYAHYRTYDMARCAEIAAYYDSCAKPLVLDLGANIGLSALYFAKNWPKATIVGVEPDQGNYALFCQNTAGHEHIVPMRGAIASKHSYARIINPHESEWGYRTEINDRNSGGLVALSVAELLERHSDCQPFICKIDIEGAEQELFSANTQWLERFPIVIIELHDWLFPRSGNSANFLRAIAGTNRDFILSGENIFSVAHRMGISEQVKASDTLAGAGIGVE